MEKNFNIFDEKMKDEFKRKTEKIPQNINDEFEKTLKSISCKNKSSKMNKLRRSGIIAASLICATTLFIQTTFAQDTITKIVKSLSLGNINILEQSKDEDIWAREVPEAAKGKVFDKDGKAVEMISKDNRNYLYNSYGEHVLVNDDGILLTDEMVKEEMEKNAEENHAETLIVTDINEIAGYLSFDLKLPSYIPDSFTFKGAELYADENNEFKNNDFCSICFENKKNGNEIYLNLTKCDDGDYGETFFSNIEKIKINGNDAILGDEAITLNIAGVNYIIFTYDLGKEESVKIAKSIK